MSIKLPTFAAGAAILALSGVAAANGGAPNFTSVPINGGIKVHSIVPPNGETPEAVQGPLQLYYSTTDLNNGTWLYNFTLENTNIDGSWQNGQNFNWIIFGDQPFPGPSNLLNWVGDNNSIAGTNFANEGFLTSQGGHNGPTLLDVDNNFPSPPSGWTPGFVGDTLTWSGTATVDLDEPDLLWSNLVGSGVHADFLPAIKIVPAPGAAGLLGLAGLAIGRRRR